MEGENGPKNSTSVPEQANSVAATPLVRRIAQGVLRLLDALGTGGISESRAHGTRDISLVSDNAVESESRHIHNSAKHRAR